jgi:hypothetical protein
LLTGTDVHVKFPQKRPLSPDSINHFYLEEGHMMEYYKIGPEEKRIVVFFWEAKEFVIPSHAYHSIFKPLDETVTSAIAYGKMIRQLRCDPQFRGYYHETKFDYRVKVNGRLNILYTLGPKERLAKLEKEQPWVFDLVEEEDNANYLRLNVGVLRRLRGNSWGSNSHPIFPSI